MLEFLFDAVHPALYRQLDAVGRGIGYHYVSLFADTISHHAVQNDDVRSKMID